MQSICADPDFINKHLIGFQHFNKKINKLGKKGGRKQEEDPQALCLKCISVFLSIFQGQTYFMVLALSSPPDGSPVLHSPRYFSPLHDAMQA